ncbi:hypothetical protein OEZ86_006537 [Tetradesmus obliquus]|nr:hypothetical protein OEZ86_006537 [Tetradesmus obliquus]
MSIHRSEKWEQFYCCMPPVQQVSVSWTLDNADSKGPAGPLFVLVHWHDNSRQFDIWLTDCSDAWSATGCTVAYQAMDADAAWKRAKEALADAAAAATQYTYSVRQPPRGPEQQLELTWSWQRSNSHVREMMRVTPPLQQQQQQDSSSAIRLIMAHVMTSYSAMKAAMDESRKAQLLLERSLSDRQQQLQQKTQEWQGKEQALFTKFAMLLNKKSERIQALTDAVQQQARQLEQLQGEEEHNTDDEALAAAYGAETEDDESDEPAQLQQHGNEQQPQQQQQQQQQQPLPSVPCLQHVGVAGLPPT